MRDPTPQHDHFTSAHRQPKEPGLMVNLLASQLSSARSADIARDAAAPARYWSHVDARHEQPSDRPSGRAAAARGGVGGRFLRAPVPRLRGGGLPRRQEPAAPLAGSSPPPGGGGGPDRGPGRAPPGGGGPRP